MNYQQYLELKGEPPIKLADGRFGLLIRGDEQEAGIQVPGEEQLRWMPLSFIEIVADGALIEVVAINNDTSNPSQHKEETA